MATHRSKLMIIYYNRLFVEVYHSELELSGRWLAALLGDNYTLYHTHIKLCSQNLLKFVHKCSSCNVHRFTVYIYTHGSSIFYYLLLLIDTIQEVQQRLSWPQWNINIAQQYLAATCTNSIYTGVNNLVIGGSEREEEREKIKEKEAIHQQKGQPYLNRNTGDFQIPQGVHTLYIVYFTHNVLHPLRLKEVALSG